MRLKLPDRRPSVTDKKSNGSWREGLTQIKGCATRMPMGEPRAVGYQWMTVRLHTMCSPSGNCEPQEVGYQHLTLETLVRIQPGRNLRSSMVEQQDSISAMCSQFLEGLTEGRFTGMSP